jgi:hypothetical protein
MSRHGRLSGGSPPAAQQKESHQARLRQASLDGYSLGMAIAFAAALACYALGHTPRRAVMTGPGGTDGMLVMGYPVAGYPVQFSVDYPARPLSRLSIAFRLILVIPIAIVLGAVNGQVLYVTVPSHNYGVTALPAGAGGALVFGPLLMILFRRKYPRWWFDWNLELQRFINRVGIYLSLMDDRYPATDDHQSVHLDYSYPDHLNRWLPLIKWLLAIPHYIVLFFLDLASFFVVIAAWFAILITGRYPRGMFGFVEVSSAGTSGLPPTYSPWSPTGIRRS